jgi:hypothetical protein
MEQREEEEDHQGGHRLRQYTDETGDDVEHGSGHRSPTFPGKEALLHLLLRQLRVTAKVWNRKSRAGHIKEPMMT